MGGCPGILRDPRPGQKIAGLSRPLPIPGRNPDYFGNVEFLLFDATKVDQHENPLS